MKMPEARGPLSATVRTVLTGGGTTPSLEAFAHHVDSVGDAVGDDDLQLALACCYELHYRGFDDVHDDLEWDPRVLRYARHLESRFESALRGQLQTSRQPSEDIDLTLTKLIDAHRGPALSSYLMKAADLQQFREFVKRRSIYHLKEADPHSWAIPRVTGSTKAALVEIQFDEYGSGRPARMHSALFARTMRGIGLDDTYGRYWADADGATFAASNLMTMFGIHRRLRGAALGHLAVFEMTSTGPNRRYGNALRRLGFGPDTTEFYDVHVEADAVHEQIAAVDMCGSFVAAEPSQRDTVVFGAASALAVDNRFADSLLNSWNYNARRVS